MTPLLPPVPNLRTLLMCSIFSEDPVATGKICAPPWASQGLTRILLQMPVWSQPMFYLLHIYCNNSYRAPYIDQQNRCAVKDLSILLQGGGLIFFRYIQLTHYYFIQAQLYISPPFPTASKEREQSRICSTWVEVHINTQPTDLAGTKGQQLRHLVQRRTRLKTFL